MSYIRSFVIGASLPVVILFYIIVLNITNKNFSYEKYSIMAPLYFGIMNVISLYLANKFNLSLRNRLFFTSIVSFILVIIFARMTKAYRNINWNMYYLSIIVLHMFAYNFIIYNLEKLV